MRHSDLIHGIVAVCVIYAISTTMCWRLTYLLASGIYQHPDSYNNHNNSNKSNRELRTNRIMAMIVCVSMSSFQPLTCVSMIYAGLYRYRSQNNPKNKFDDLTKNTYWSLAVGFGIPGSILYWIATITWVCLIIRRLDVFDTTTSEMSEQRKKMYHRGFALSVGMTIVWMLWNHVLVRRNQLAFFAFSMAIAAASAVLILLLIMEWAHRLTKFLELTHDPDTTGTNNNNGHVPERSGSNISQSDCNLLNVIVKHSMLSMWAMISLLFAALFFLPLSLFGGIPLSMYANFGPAQFALTVSLCTYLSQNFADNYYHWICGRFHESVQTRTVLTLAKVPSETS